MRTAIVTGLGVFGDYAVNPTEILARKLAGEVVAGHKIHSMVFPTTIFPSGESVDVGTRIVTEAISADASVIISFGITSVAKGVRVETMCTNWVESKYCSPHENGRPLSDARTHQEKLRMPLASWDLDGLSIWLGRADIPFELSEDAGMYCCNALMYRVLLSLSDRMVRIPFIFVHLPCTEESVVTLPDFDRANKVLFRQGTFEAVLEILLGAYVPQTKRNFLKYAMISS